MASVATLFARMLVVGVVIGRLLTRVESMPMASPEVRSFDDAGAGLLLELDQGTYDRAEIDRLLGMEIEDGTREKSAQYRHSEEIVSEEEENRDDLETAAGTNVLRPLFVYRQQVAYRERVKKAGRRAAPNF